MTATALRAAVDDGSAFASARDLPAPLGHVPRQHTTGSKPKLLGISKRGNAYQRGLFIHGARAALASLSKVEDAIGRWLRGLLARAHYIQCTVLSREQSNTQSQGSISSYKYGISGYYLESITYLLDL